MTASDIQRKMHQMQNSDDISSIFGKLVSGKSGYKAAIDVSRPAPRCKICQVVLGGEEKFCPECGSKL